MSSIFWSLPGWLAQDRVQGDWWALDPVKGPADEPVTIQDVKVQARVDNSTRDDVSIAGFLVAARMMVEKLTNRCLLPQTWSLSLQQWPTDRVLLPRAPLIGVDSVNWTNISEVQQIMDPGQYDVNLSGDPGSVVLRFGQIWPPDPLSPSSPIKIQFQAGYPRFSGLATIDPDGVTMNATGSPLIPFDPTWTANQAILVDGTSLTIRQVVSPTQLILYPVSLSSGTTTPIQWSVNLVPAPLRLAVLMLATHWFGPGRTPVIVGRGVTSADISLTVKKLIQDYRINTFGFRQVRSMGAPYWP
jgi:uncharacterized phiE125 gp8 family phage protein